MKNSSRLSSSAQRVSSSIASGTASTDAVCAEGEAGDPAECRDVLILLADRLAEPVDLDVAGLLGEFARMDDAAACACSARSSAVVKLPDEPSPVPAGISASVVISICGAPKSNCLSASRTIGCCTSSIVSTCSILEYLR